MVRHQVLMCLTKINNLPPFFFRLLKVEPDLIYLPGLPFLAHHALSFLLAVNHLNLFHQVVFTVMIIGVLLCPLYFFFFLLVKYLIFKFGDRV